MRIFKTRITALEKQKQFKNLCESDQKKNLEVFIILSVKSILVLLMVITILLLIKMLRVLRTITLKNLKRKNNN